MLEKTIFSICLIFIPCHASQQILSLPSPTSKNTMELKEFSEIKLTNLTISTGHLSYNNHARQAICKLLESSNRTDLKKYELLHREQLQERMSREKP